MTSFSAAACTRSSLDNILCSSSKAISFFHPSCASSFSWLGSLPHHLVEAEPADVVAHNDEDVGFLLLRLRLGESERGKRNRQSHGPTDQRPAT
jgi:hypothetical protein